MPRHGRAAPPILDSAGVADEDAPGFATLKRASLGNSVRLRRLPERTIRMSFAPIEDMAAASPPWLDGRAS